MPCFYISQWIFWRMLRGNWADFLGTESLGAERCSTRLDFAFSSANDWISHRRVAMATSLENKEIAAVVTMMLMYCWKEFFSLKTRDLQLYLFYIKDVAHVNYNGHSMIVQCFHIVQLLFGVASMLLERDWPTLRVTLENPTIRRTGNKFIGMLLAGWSSSWMFMSLLLIGRNVNFCVILLTKMGLHNQ